MIPRGRMAASDYMLVRLEAEPRHLIFQRDAVALVVAGSSASHVSFEICWWLLLERSLRSKASGPAIPLSLSLRTLQAGLHRVECSSLSML
eukprot:s1084_g6.t1